MFLGIDHDDGSQFHNDVGNFLVFGGCKNYLGVSGSGEVEALSASIRACARACVRACVRAYVRARVRASVRACVDGPLHPRRAQAAQAVDTPLFPCACTRARTPHRLQLPAQNHKQCDSNFILYPGTSGRSAGGHRCQTDDNGVFAEQFHLGNVCATEDGRVLDFAGCNAGNVNSTAYATAYNTYLVDAGSALQGPCGTGTFEHWQSLGQDVGSAVASTPSVEALISLGAAKVLGA